MQMISLNQNRKWQTEKSISQMGHVSHYPAEGLLRTIVHLHSISGWMDGWMDGRSDGRTDDGSTIWLPLNGSKSTIMESFKQKEKKSSTRAQSEWACLAIDGNQSAERWWGRAGNWSTCMQPSTRGRRRYLPGTDRAIWPHGPRADSRRRVCSHFWRWTCVMVHWRWHRKPWCWWWCRISRECVAGNQCYNRRQTGTWADQQLGLRILDELRRSAAIRCNIPGYLTGTDWMHGWRFGSFGNFYKD